MPIDKELLKGSHSILILSLLSQNDMYGYQITKELAERSKNIFNLKEGTLYPLLHLLENDGYIQSYWEETPSARKRRYYHLTDSGKKLLVNKKQEWQTFSQAVNQVIGGAVIECH